MARPLIHLTHDDACLIDAATDMLAALNELMPTGVCLTNANIGDSVVIPCDVQIGTLRRAAAAIAKATGAKKIITSDFTEGLIPAVLDDEETHRG